MTSEDLRTRIEHVADTRSARLAAWLYRRTHGRIARLWRRRVLVLTTTGRRSGEPRTVPVQYFPDGDAMVVVAANSGMSSHPGWYYNLRAHPAATVEVDGEAIPVRAALMSAEEARRFWPRVLAAAPDYARFPRRTDREIPLFRLLPQRPGPG